MPRASLHGTSHGPTHTAQPRQPCARCLSHHARRSARKARFSEMVTRPPPPRVRGRPGQLLGVSSRRTAPIHRWLLPPRCHAPLSPHLSLQCSLLSARVAYRLPHLSCSRVAFASARAQPPSNTGDGWLAQLASVSRFEPSLSVSTGADAPGLIRGILRHALDHRELPEIASCQTGLADSRAELQLRFDTYRAGWLARPAISGVGPGHGCACRDVAGVCPGRLSAARAALDQRVWWRMAIRHPCARPAPVARRRPLVQLPLRRSRWVRVHVHALCRCRAGLPEAS